MLSAHLTRSQDLLGAVPRVALFYFIRCSVHLFFYIAFGLILFIDIAPLKAQASENASEKSLKQATRYDVVSHVGKGSIDVIFITDREIVTNFEEIRRETGKVIDWNAAIVNHPDRHNTFLGRVVIGEATLDFPSDRSSFNLGHSKTEINTYKYFGVSDVRKKDLSYFVKRLKQSSEAFGNQGRNRPLVYIHGFNTSFVESVEQAAQLKADLDRTTTILFSWPSNPIILPVDPDPFDRFMYRVYYNDYIDAQKVEGLSERDFDPYMEILSLSTKLKPDVIAHSMGSKLFFDLFENSISQGAKLEINKLILAAADLKTQSFESRASHWSSLAFRPFAYCAFDYLLEASREVVHHVPRLGLCELSAPMVKDTVMIKVEGPMTDKYRHSYYVGASEMIEDMKAIFNLTSEQGPLTKSGRVIQLQK